MDLNPERRLAIVKRLDFVSAPFIVLSAVSLVVGTELDDASDVAWMLRQFETVLSVLFTVEYAARLYLGGRKYAFSLFGVVDLLAGIPGLLILAGSSDLMALRLLRIFRLFALLKVGRYNTAAARLGRALRSVREEFALLGATAGTVLYLSAFGIHYFEHEAQPEEFATFGDCLWWAIVSLTTVGYGDAYPTTPGGKAFASLVLLLSLGIVAAPAGLIAAALTSQRSEREEP
ncbi:MAG: ion transporter [Gammaproteobacteria bacterium]|nr:ion transporter [Gammaproteobacteria bacterium]